MLKSKEPIVIVLASDQGYFDGLWITLVSLMLYTNTKRHLKIYVFDGGIHSDSKQKLLKELHKLNSNFTLEWIVPDLRQFKSLISMGSSYMTYARIFIPNMIAEPKVIWLDVDLLVLNDIELLWDIDIKGYPLAGCQESPSVLFKDDVSNLSKLGISADAPYFNAGILVMDNRALLKMNFSKKCVHFLQENSGNYKFWDQSAINVICYNQIKSLDRAWNYLNTLQKSAQADYDLVMKGNYIYHFLQRPKPWQKFSNTIHTQLLYKLAELSGLELMELKKRESQLFRLKWRYPKVYKRFVLLTNFFIKRPENTRAMLLAYSDHIKTYQNDLKLHKKEIQQSFSKIEQIYHVKVKSNA
jgi:lipopolysaccharide biosynthesis glycosyltransferase